MKAIAVKYWFVLFIQLLLLTSLFAQPGRIDNSFNPTDQGFDIGHEFNGSVRATAIQSDGKIIVAGAFTAYNGISRGNIARLNPDGSLDTSFNPGMGANGQILAITIQPDGKILIGGLFTFYNGIERNRIARLNADGSLDGTFDPGVGADGEVNSIGLQTDQKIIIGGLFNSYTGTIRNRIARLNNNGTLDFSFNPGTGANLNIQSLIVQLDGKIIIGGFFTSYNGTERNRIARLNTDGSLDTSFNPSLGANGIVYSTAIQFDGKVIIAGQFTTFNGEARNRIARLNIDGSLDNTFMPSTGSNGLVLTVRTQFDGRIIIGGSFTSYNSVERIRIARLNVDGSLDFSFDPGIGANGAVYTVLAQSDNKVLCGGDLTSFNAQSIGRLIRLETNGSVDTNFFNAPSAGGFNSLVQNLAISSDEKSIASGSFTFFGEIGRNHITRLNPDGSLDASFNPGIGANQMIRSIQKIQSDGKIVIGGDFTFYNNTARNYIARINNDGSLDTSFDAGTGPNGIVSSLLIQPDEKIIIGGFSFTSLNGVPRNRIARLNTDGSLDVSFNPGTGANSTVSTLLIQPDGKIIIGGLFTSFNDTPRNRIARLNVDGSLDVSFNPGLGANNSINEILLQPDGKIIIGGLFTSFNGTDQNRIARLNPDGSLDLSFNSGSGANSMIRAMLLQPNDKLIIGGDFTSYNGIERNFLARLNLDGTLDSSFQIGEGANNSVWSFIQQNLNYLIIAGAFTAYNNVGRNRVARIFLVSPELAVSSESVSVPNGGNLTFANTTIGSTSDRQIMITNTGDQDMTISSVNVTGDFTIVGAPPATLAIGASTTLTVRFIPSTSGTITGSLTINSDASTSLYIINISGIGFVLGAIIDVSNDGVAKPIGSNVTFSTTGVGSSQLKELAITNTGTADLVITDIQVTGDFNLISPLPPPVAPGASTIITLAFAPTDLGQRTGTLTILSNGDIAVYTINLLGEGDAEPEVYNVVTANPNGKHDFLNIRNINLFPNNRVTIYDRWGNQVYEKESYDNVTNPFTGKSDKGKELPDGTYYYVIDKNNGSDRLTGFILLRR